MSLISRSSPSFRDVLRCTRQAVASVRQGVVYQMKINGNEYSDEVLAQGVTADNAWEQDVFDFLREWFAPAESVNVYTSGSTGKPKLLHAKKAQMLASARRTLDFFGLHGGMRAHLCLPVEYIAGKMMVVRAFAGNLELLVEKPSGAPEFGGVAVDFSALTPMQLRGAAESGSLENARCVLVGGGRVSSVIRHSVAALSCRVVESYGMTETLSHVALRPLSVDGSEPFCAMDGVSFSLDSRQCLVVHDRVAGDGRALVTNDLAELVDTRSFHWRGRLDNIINSGGIKLPAEEIERKIENLLPDTRYFVAGEPDDLLGEQVVLYIEDAECRITRADLCPVLSAYELPRRIKVGVRFENTGSGKIRRKK